MIWEKRLGRGSERRDRWSWGRAWGQALLLWLLPLGGRIGVLCLQQGGNLIQDTNLSNKTLDPGLEVGHIEMVKRYDHWIAVAWLLVMAAIAASGQVQVVG